MFAVMAQAFAEEARPLPDDYVDALLQSDAFWVLAAFADKSIIGGLTAHTLPLTRSPSAELFIYDLAVHQDHRRRGVGRRLILDVRDAARAANLGDFVLAADQEDTYALEFYRAQGGAAALATIFTFTPE